ncbi:MAG: hypothetical protein RLZZ584_1023 [Pseudomonadota bacterium]
MELPLDAPLDAPLPVEIAGRGHGWFTAYRRYPVFSRPWIRGRLRLTGTVLGFIAVLVGGVLLDSPPEERPWGATLQVALQLLLPALLVPWLGGRVRRRGWPPEREWRALLALVLVEVALFAVVHQFAAEPLKQWVAERTGALNADGSRKRVMLAVGVSVISPRGAPTAWAAPAASGAGAPGASGAGGQADAAGQGRSDVAAATDMPPTPAEDLLGLLMWSLAAFWLGGGLALWGWRRERAGLLDLQRERELQRAQAERREAEMRLSVLAAQVEPHFLFNTLAGVRAAIVSDPARASEMVDHLVDYLRATIPRLRSDGSALATLGGQLDIVRAYLGLMATRMRRLQFSVDAPAGLLDHPCPAWMLISLVENAVKHGVEPKVGPVRIEVSARRSEAGQLEICVADDGVGFGAAPAAWGSGLGLANIRERLASLHGGHAALVLRQRPGGGTLAIIGLPLEDQAPSASASASAATPAADPAMR